MLKLTSVSFDLGNQLLTTGEVILSELELAKLILQRYYFRRIFGLIVV